MEKQYRYLINNSVMQGGEMPIESNYTSTTNYIGAYEDWQQSLVKLCCNEVELDKISKTFGDIFTQNPLDITSITTVKGCKVYFKEVECESQEDLMRELISLTQTKASINIILQKFTITRK